MKWFLRVNVWYTLIAIIIAAFISASLPAISSPKCDACPRDGRGRIERSASAKTQFKRDNPCPATGSHKGACAGWVIDHVTPLKRGGADAPSNLQWQTTEEAKAKDRWE